jgi:hypothetical protein
VTSRSTPTRARPREFCTEDPDLLTKSKQVCSLFFCVTDQMQKSPPTSIPLPDAPSTPFTHGGAPASIYAGRLGQRPGSPSSGHEINTTPTISPNLIWLFINYGALATMAVSSAARPTRSRRPEATPCKSRVWQASQRCESAQRESRGHGLTGIGLATVSSVSRWRKSDLGRMGNSCVLVDDRGWERVL